MSAYIILAAEDGAKEVELCRWRSWEAAHGYCTGASGAWQHRGWREDGDIYTRDGDPVVYRIVHDPDAEWPDEPIENTGHYVTPVYVIWGPGGKRLEEHPTRAQATMRMAAMVREMEQDDVPF